MSRFSEEKQMYFEKEMSKLNIEQSRINLLSRLLEECKTKAAESIIIDNVGSSEEKLYYETVCILQKNNNPSDRKTERIKRQITNILRKSSAKFLFLRPKWYNTKVCSFSPKGEEGVLRLDVNSNHKSIQERILRYILKYLPEECKWSAEEDYEILKELKGFYLKNIEIWYDRQMKTNRLKLIFMAFHYLPLLYLSRYYLSPYFQGWWDQERYLELLSVLNTGNKFSCNAISFIYNLDGTEKKTCYGFIMAKSIRFTDILQPFELPTKERKERIKNVQGYVL